MNEIPLTPIPRKLRRPRSRFDYSALLRWIAWTYVVVLVGALCSLLVVKHPLTRTKIWLAVVESVFVALLVLSLAIAVKAKTPRKRGVALGGALAVVSGFCFAHTVLPFLAFSAMHEGGGFRIFVQAGWQVPFDAEAWRRNETPFWSRPIRYRMAEDLVGKRVLVGKTPGEVEQLLGHWDNTTYPFPDCNMVYVLKPTFTDHLWVALALDENGRVKTARIRED